MSSLIKIKLMKLTFSRFLSAEMYPKAGDTHEISNSSLVKSGSVHE